MFLLRHLSEYISLEVVYFLRSKSIVVALAEDDDAASHLEEHGTLEHFVEGLSANHLTMLEHEGGIVVLESCLHSLCQLWRTGTEVRYYGDFSSHVARHLRCYVEVLRCLLHARNHRGILRLEVEHYVAVGTLTEYAEMETALHRWLHAVKHLAVCHTADCHLLLGECRHPRAGARNERFVADAP